MNAEAEPVPRLNHPCRYCEAPFGYRVRVKRHFEVFCGACGAYLYQMPWEPTTKQFYTNPLCEQAEYRGAVRRFIAALENSPILNEYRDGSRLMPEGPPHGAYPDGRYVRERDETESEHEA